MNLGIGLSLTNFLRVPTVPLEDLDAAIAALFSSGEVGAWYDPSDSSTVWQDAAGTTPAGVGDPVGRIDDKSGNGNHATQATSAARPVLQQSGGLYYLDFDGVDDNLSTTFASAQAQPNTIGCGFKHDSVASGTSDYRPVFDGTSTARHTFNLYPADGTPGKHNIGAGIPSIRGANNADTNAHVMLGHFNTTSSELRIDASSVASGAIGTNAWGGVWLGVFSTTGSYWLDGRIYSFVGVNRTLTAGEITDLETYLAAKSGVTL